MEIRAGIAERPCGVEESFNRQLLGVGAACPVLRCWTKGQLFVVVRRPIVEIAERMTRSALGKEEEEQEQQLHGVHDDEDRWARPPR